MTARSRQQLKAIQVEWSLWPYALTSLRCPPPGPLSASPGPVSSPDTPARVLLSFSRVKNKALISMLMLLFSPIHTFPGTSSSKLKCTSAPCERSNLSNSPLNQNLLTESPEVKRQSKPLATNSLTTCSPAPPDSRGSPALWAPSRIRFSLTRSAQSYGICQC